MVKVTDEVCELSTVCDNLNCHYYASPKKLERLDDELTRDAGLFAAERPKHRILEFDCPYLAWKEAQRSKEQ